MGIDFMQIALLGGAGLVVLAVVKPEILNNILGTNIGGSPAIEEPTDDEEVDPNRTPNTISNSTLPKSLQAVNFYSGKIAGMISVMAKNNIFSATQIKQYILDKHIAEIEHIAQLVDFETEEIDFANVVAIREISKVVIDVSKELRIEYKVQDVVALEVIAQLGRGFGNLPPSGNQGLVVQNVLKYLSGRFNGSPEIKFTGENDVIHTNININLNKKDNKDSDFARARSARVSGQRVLNVLNVRRI